MNSRDPRVSDHFKNEELNPSSKECQILSTTAHKYCHLRQCGCECHLKGGLGSTSTNKEISYGN